MHTMQENEKAQETIYRILLRYDESPKSFQQSLRTMEAEGRGEYNGIRLRGLSC